ncbi:helix-turn-helix domain-containing protein [Streptomyces luteogriseus]
MSKETPATSSDTHERSEYVYRLNVAELLKHTATRGDKTGYKIHRRTGIAQSAVYRILAGEAQPDLNSAMRLSEAYDLDIREVMERVAVEAAA